VGLALPIVDDVTKLERDAFLARDSLDHRQTALADRDLGRVSQQNRTGDEKLACALGVPLARLRSRLVPFDDVEPKRREGVDALPEAPPERDDAARGVLLLEDLRGAVDRVGPLPAPPRAIEEAQQLQIGRHVACEQRRKQADPQHTRRPSDHPASRSIACGRNRVAEHHCDEKPDQRHDQEDVGGGDDARRNRALRQDGQRHRHEERSSGKLSALLRKAR